MNGRTPSPSARQRGTARLPFCSAAADFFVSRGMVFALGIFAAVGFAVLDDYGVSRDEPVQREIGHAQLDYVLGDKLPLRGLHRFYGGAFEVPLVLVERLLGLKDSRDVYLGRHLAGHLFFLAGGFFCYLLAYRLFDNRLLAIFAMLLFLLHPRLYAHSFFNSKDMPFLSMFMIALYLVHRAFGRNTIAAFALCGLGVGLPHQPPHHGRDAVRRGCRHAGVRPPPCRTGGGAEADSGDRRSVPAGRRACVVHLFSVVLEKSVQVRRDVCHILPVSHAHRFPLPGRACPLARDSGAIRSRLDCNHHAAGLAPAEPSGDGVRAPSRREPPGRRAPEHHRPLRIPVDCVLDAARSCRRRLRCEHL